MSFWDKVFSSENSGKIKALGPILAQVNEAGKRFSTLEDESLRVVTGDFKRRLAAGEKLDDLLPEVFAAVREAARRTLGERHFDVQIAGGILLHRGTVVEMRTGEGKTLVATLPAYLNALTGRGVHIVTVNDYLARRDTQWMGQVYHFLGLSVGVINHDASYLYDASHSERDRERDAEGSFRVFYDFLKPCTRQEAYQADITYGTNSEFGFDYLRDNLVYRPEEVRGRRPGGQALNYFAIVDEVDSILIDEARTPLIISAPLADAASWYAKFAKLAEALVENSDFTVDEKLKAIALNDSGIEKAEKMLGVDNIYSDKGIKYVHHLETAVRAKALFRMDRDYVIKNGEIVIVDEFTGRLQPGRRWSEGLHQAIEAKEGVDVRAESRTYATITYQNYFRLYEKLSGMTGTALTSEEEFRKVYGLETVAVPTNRPSKRSDLSDLVFQTEQGKFKAIANKVKELNQSGQPVLLGTVSIEKSEMIAAYLKQSGVPHRVLNAKNHEEEGLVIAEAGKEGSVVVATNMAGRGVDIKLGGATPSAAERERIRNLGGLFVLGTERHEARRIDNQLRGRSGRQGDPGTTQFFLSLEDPLMRVFGSERVKNMMGKFGIPEDEPIQHRLVTRAIESAQEKIEGLNFDLRKHLLEYDDVINHQRRIIYERRNKLLSGDTQAVDNFFNTLFPENKTGTSDIRGLVDDKRQALGKEFYNAARTLGLQVIDLLWVEHLETMEYLRGSVRLRAYGQRDPLVEYRKEGLRLFRELEGLVAVEVAKLVPSLGAELKEESPPLAEIKQTPKVFGLAGNTVGKLSPVGRNDPCPCGAKKPDGAAVKFKRCHGK